MGLRDKLRKRFKDVVGRLSGDYSAAAPDRTEGYKKPGVPNEDAEVVMAQLRRPPPKGGASGDDE